MKKILTVLLTAALLLAFCSCASEEDVNGKNESQQTVINQDSGEDVKIGDDGENAAADEVSSDEAMPDGESSEGTTEETTDAAQEDNLDESTEDEENLMPEDGSEEIALILEGVLEVEEFESGDKVTLYDLGVVNSMYAGVPARYAQADFDGDGILELAVEFSLMGDTALICKYDGKWIAHYRSYRDMSGLIDSGVYKWSHSAFVSGMSKIYFLEGRLVEVVMTESVTEEDGTTKYFVDEKEADYGKYADRTAELERSGSALEWQEF